MWSGVWRSSCPRLTAGVAQESECRAAPKCHMGPFSPTARLEAHSSCPVLLGGSTDWIFSRCACVLDQSLHSEVSDSFRHSMQTIRVLSHSVVFDSLQPHKLQPTRLLCPWDSPGKNTGMCCHSLLQGIFPTQELNPGLLHWLVDSLPLEPLGKPPAPEFLHK